jgi:hypothetical protein
VTSLDELSDLFGGKWRAIRKVELGDIPHELSGTDGFGYVAASG